MDYLYTLFKFLIGGGMVVGTTWLARYVDPRYGGILIAAPIVTSVAFFLTYTESGATATRQLALASFFFVIPTLLFILALFLLMGRIPFYQSLAGSFAVWIAGILVVNQVLPGA
ncbi:MAG: GlpM family protein [Methanoregulaceae archaeon]|nr:GlpM family protein [Methanoregulaceae archaeon]